MTDLSQIKCIPCRGGDPMLTADEIAELHPQVSEWQIVEVHGVNRLQRVFKFKDYIEAVAFANKIAMTAEKVDHHPLLIVEWGKVTVWW